MYQARIVPVAGPATEGVWSQSGVFPAHHGGNTIQLDSSSERVLFLSLTVRRSMEAESAGETGQSILREIGEAAEDLKRWQEEAVPRRLLDRNEVMSCLGVEIRGNHLKIWGRGGSALILRRGEQIGRLLVTPEKEWVMKEGVWKAGDKLFMGTAGLVGETSPQLIADLLHTLQIETAGEELSTQVLANEDSATATGAIVWLNEVNEMDGVIEESDDQEQPAPMQVDEPSSTIKPSVFLRNHTKRRKTAFSVGIVLLVLLALSIGLGWQRRQEIDQKKRFEALTIEVDQLVSQARLQVRGSGTTAALVDQAKTKLLTAKNEYQDNQDYTGKIDSKLAEIDTIYASISGVNQLADIPVWFDLGIIREGMQGIKMAMANERMVILDQGKGILGTIEIPSKEVEVVGGGNLLTNATTLGLEKARAIVGTDKGIVEVLVNQKTSAYIIPASDGWGRMVAVEMFNGNVYAVDAEHNEIWQYPGLAKGVGERRKWLKSETGPDMSKVVDMAIDGEVWLLSETGAVLRFNRGVKQNFEISQMDQPLGKAMAVYTDPTIDSLYI